MAITQLSLLALPGQRSSFLGKTPAPIGGPHTGLFTELSVLGLPGKKHTFLAKIPGLVGGPHTGLFTNLSVMGLPGKRHSFTAKGLIIVPPIPPIIPTILPTLPSGIVGEREAFKPYYKHTILQDDRDIMEIILIMLNSGILD